MEGRIQAVEQGKWAGCSDRHWWRGASSGSDGSVRETVEDQDWDQLMSEEDTGTICGCRPSAWSNRVCPIYRWLSLELRQQSWQPLESRSERDQMGSSLPIKYRRSNVNARGINPLCLHQQPTHSPPSKCHHQQVHCRIARHQSLAARCALFRSVFM